MYSYYENKKPKELITFSDNVLDGQCIAWDSLGNITAIGNYKLGLKHGEWKIWYDNGRLAYSFHYKNGQKIGVWKSWNKNGVLISKKEYQ